MTALEAAAWTGIITSVGTQIVLIIKAFRRDKQMDVQDRKLNAIHALTDGNLTEAVAHIDTLKQVIVAKDAQREMPKSDKAGTAIAAANVAAAVEAAAARPPLAPPAPNPLFPPSLPPGGVKP